VHPAVDAGGHSQGAAGGDLVEEGDEGVKVERDDVVRERRGDPTGLRPFNFRLMRPRTFHASSVKSHSLQREII
jgi:hypothetical protein